MCVCVGGGKGWGGGGGGGGVGVQAPNPITYLRMYIGMHALCSGMFNKL